MDILQSLLDQTRESSEHWPYQHLTDTEFRQRIREGLVILLRQRFGGMDFWSLSKNWKELRYESVVNELLAELDLIIELLP